MTHPSPTAPLPPHLERAYEAKVFKAARPKGSHNAPHLNLACALADDVVALHNRLEAAEAQLATRLPDREAIAAKLREWADTGESFEMKARWLHEWLLSGAATPAPTAAHLRRFREQTEAEVFGYVTGVEDAAALYESVNPASDDERIKGSPGAGAMGAVIEYRDKIRELLHAKSPPQGAEE